MKQFASKAELTDYYNEYYKSIGKDAAIPVPGFASFFDNQFEDYFTAKLTADGDDAANPVSAPDLSDAHIVDIPYLGEGRSWADMARSNGVDILSERALNINSPYDPKEYSYTSPHTGSTVWVYVHTLSGPDSDVDAGVYAQRPLSDAEAEYVLSTDRN